MSLPSRLPRLLGVAAALGVVPLLFACGSSGDSSMVAPRHDRGAVAIAPPSAPIASDAMPPDGPAPCEGDGDCASTDLCVDGVCRRACHDDAACAAGTCHTETDGGWCYNAPGCNPPPPGVMCPTLCYGYCMGG